LNRLELNTGTVQLIGTAKTNIKKGQLVRVNKHTKTFDTIAVWKARIKGFAEHDAKKGEKLAVQVPQGFFKK